MLWNRILRSSSRCSPRALRLRSLTKLSAGLRESPEDKMQAWQVHSYNGVDDLRLCSVRLPMIARPTDVLVKVEAASVNPLDVAMTRGYGETVFKLMRKARGLLDEAYDEIELPLTLGRDFAGVVVAKGCDVKDKLEIGDEVWGVVPTEQQGCHANYVMVNSSIVRPRPRGLSHIEAASILYTGLTAWSALWLTGGLYYKTAMITRMNRRVLVMGGSGGVGTMAIQLLKSWNMQVVSTCSDDAVDALRNLGADIVIDYKQNDADTRIISEGPYDIILDCAKQGPEYVKTKRYPHDIYITLNSPLLKNIDEHGLVVGMAKNFGDLVKFNIPGVGDKSCVKWGFFVPSKTGIDVIQRFVENGKIVPVIQQVYPFQDLPLAYKKLSEGHSRGKLVIDMKQQLEESNN